MKVAYFDCKSGISGDMIGACLADVGVPLEEIVKPYGLPYNLTLHEVTRKGIRAKHLSITIDKPLSSFSEMIKMVNSCSIKNTLKERIVWLIEKLEAVEKKVHQNGAPKHHQELISFDTLFDITIAICGFDYLNIDKVYVSTINIGDMSLCGWATLELLHDFRISTDDSQAELTTPTGALILRGLSCTQENLSNFKVQHIGYGAGTKELTNPNILRLIIGEIDGVFGPFCIDNVYVVETNIDDMNPQIYEYLIDELFSQGALDVFLTPIYMKRTRPGILLSVIAKEADIQRLSQSIFKQTTTLGVRIIQLQRFILPREEIYIETQFGKIRGKYAKIHGETKIIPEYADCKELAYTHKLPLIEIYRHAQEAAAKWRQSDLNR